MLLSLFAIQLVALARSTLTLGVTNDTRITSRQASCDLAWRLYTIRKRTFIFLTSMNYDIYYAGILRV